MNQKRTFFLNAALCGLLAFTAGCSSAEKQNSDNPSENENQQTETQKTDQPADSEKADAEQSELSDILVAWFSPADHMPDDADAVTYATAAAGNVKDAAEEIAELTGGELFEIQTVESYPTNHQENSEKAHQEQEENARPELASHVEDMSKYSTVILCYPIWWHEEPAAINSFLDEYDFAGKKIVPFAESMEVPIDQSQEKIQQLCPDAVVSKGLRLPTGEQADPQVLSQWLSANGVPLVSSDDEGSE